MDFSRWQLDLDAARDWHTRALAAARAAADAPVIAEALAGLARSRAA